MKPTSTSPAQGAPARYHSDIGYITERPPSADLYEVLEYNHESGYRLVRCNNGLDVFKPAHILGGGIRSERFDLSDYPAALDAWKKKAGATS